MKRFFHKIFSRRQAARTPIAPRLSPLPNLHWTEDDAKRLAEFLAGETGGRFIALGNQRLFEIALTGANDEMHTTYAGGCTRGFHDALRWLNSLSRVSRAPETPTEQAPEGEEQLLEAMSP